MSGFRPRRTVHSGSVLAGGMAIDARLVGESEARARIIRLSESAAAGSAVFRIGSMLVLRLSAALRVSCSESEGTPLVRYGQLLSAAPLTAGELKDIESREDSVLLVVGGVATVAAFQDAIREDIAQWIDVSDFDVVEAADPLGRTVAETPREQLTAGNVDIRKSLGLAPLDVAGNQLIAALKQRNAAQGTTSGSGRPGRKSWFAGLANGLAAVRNAWQGRGRPAGSRTIPGASASRHQARAEPRRQPLREFLARALWSSKLAGLIGRQHARYLARMLALFDDGDLDAALRHAIPLGKGLDSSNLRLPLWAPSPRNDLSISPQRQPGGTSLGVGDDLFGYLRQRYRQAFERLSAAGEIEKAAFVLAELLDANEEAVLFLERRGHLRLAAEVAEGRNLPSGLVIRQWFLAGERARAVSIARRTGAFADAVVRLESSHREQAMTLRLLWADALASGGLYSAAVDVAWPVESARNLVDAWIDRAIEIGGAAGARMLARKLRLRPGEFAQISERVLALLASESQEARACAVAFAQELVSGESTAETRVLARAAARRLLRQAPEALDQTLLSGLVRVSGDDVFQADVRPLGKLPTVQQPTDPLRSRSQPLVIGRQAADRGTMAVRDVALLPDGSMLVGAGEVGALLLSPQGKVQARFAEPTSRIIVSDHGDRSILAAKRGELYRLSRIDLVGRRVRPWCDARIDQGAPDFDGLTWFVSRGGAVYAIDATASRFEQFWKADEADAVVRDVRRSSTGMSVLFDWERKGSSKRPSRPCEVWTYELPSLTLRRRNAIEASGGPLVVKSVSAEGEVAGWSTIADPQAGWPRATKAWRQTQSGERKDAFEVSEAASMLTWAGTPWLSRDWALFPTQETGRVVLHLLDMATLQVRAELSLEGETLTIGARFQDERLIVFDDAGRILTISLSNGEIVREFRL